MEPKKAVVLCSCVVEVYLTSIAINCYSDVRKDVYKHSPFGLFNEPFTIRLFCGKNENKTCCSFFEPLNHSLGLACCTKIPYFTELGPGRNSVIR